MKSFPKDTIKPEECSTLTSNETLLMIPGPTNLPEPVREALSQPSIYHRGDQFAQLLEVCSEGLKPLFGTENEVLILTSSSTGAMEAGIVNFLSPGDRVVAITTGKFGERLGEIATAFGAEVSGLTVEPGRAATPTMLDALAGQVNPKAVLLAQNETSTGVCQDVAALAEVANDHGALVLVDAVSSLGGIPFEMDNWSVDVVMAGSQKALMLPPGLSFVTASPRAWQAAQSAQMPRYYFDLRAASQSAVKGQTPYTPNINMIVALAEVVALIQAEGLPNVYRRHHQMGEATRAAVQALDLRLFADPEYASDVVTAIQSPDELDSTQLVKQIRDKHNILISGGQGKLKGKIFRIGHLGCAGLREVRRTIKALAESLLDLGYQCSPDAALQAIEEIVANT